MMTVEQLMTRPVDTCHPEDSLSAAARIMWERDCGCAPVVDPSDGPARVVGMITDRDICMAAYTKGQALCDILVESAMARDICSCRFTDSVATALRILEQNQLHRLPVLDQHDRLVGILSLADAARAAGRQPRDSGVTEKKLVEVLESIAAPRASTDIAAAT